MFQRKIISKESQKNMDETCTLMSVNESNSDPQHSQRKISQIGNCAVNCICDSTFSFNKLPVIGVIEVLEFNRGSNLGLGSLH